MEKQSALETDIQFLPGVGPRRARMLAQELDIHSFGDLIRLYPYRYVDRSSLTDIADIRSDAAAVQVRARVRSAEMKDKRLSVILEDRTGSIEAVFFKGVKWMSGRLLPGTEWIFFGKPQLFNGRFNFVHPEVDSPEKAISQGSGKLTGIYPSTEKLKNAGITGKVMNRLKPCRPAFRKSKRACLHTYSMKRVCRTSGQPSGTYISPLTRHVSKGLPQGSSSRNSSISSCPF